MKKLLTALALGSALTATVYAQRPQTDRDFDGLKGPVKSVVVEAANLKRQGARDVEGPRVLAQRVTYNADGNRADDEWYDDSDGVLLTKNVYRYVGGEKLADGQVIIPSIIIPNLAARPRARNKQPARAPAPRPMESVSEKYVYKYDGQGCVTELNIMRDGRVRNRVTYDYRSGLMEMRAHQGGDTLSFGRVDRFDAQGNLVESTAFNRDSGGRVDKSTYTAYEFDARGNWVKRVKAESRGGEAEDRRVEYRTLTYF